MVHSLHRSCTRLPPAAAACALVAWAEDWRGLGLCFGATSAGAARGGGCVPVVQTRRRWDRGRTGMRRMLMERCGDRLWAAMPGCWAAMPPTKPRTKLSLGLAQPSSESSCVSNDGRNLSLESEPAYTASGEAGCEALCRRERGGQHTHSRRAARGSPRHALRMTLMHAREATQSLACHLT
jgi:hypothetical protein